MTQPLIYCEPQDVRNALSPDGNTSGTNTAADLDDTAIEDAIAEAQSIVDAYIGGPYDETQGDEIPDVILFWTRDIAAYYATLTWRKSKAPAANNPVVTRYERAMAMLEAVQKGDLEIMAPSMVDDQPVTFNPLYNGSLFDSDDFDLTGRNGVSNGSFPLMTNGIAVFWAQDPDQDFP